MDFDQPISDALIAGVALAETEPSPAKRLAAAQVESTVFFIVHSLLG